ncbi:MAG: hypothetical protein CSA55_01045 [Ilumatobacter coccineus]|uniref:Orc1-like AAA ATPase domain-containing protein n=1 Tax=Ilumatobacter coccineus TaxID=467094 RepID=A0A2G6KFG6_9ACTN|nr:MAG: hypothetical protein CSA55_01045 [Ilumatobacter coccineus]
MDEVNPFRPGFGEYPVVRAGRHQIVARLTQALHPSLRSHPARQLILLGDRGIGKTVLLDDAHDIAVQYGWRVVEVAGPGEGSLSQRIVNEIWSPVPGEGSTSVSLSAGPVKATHTWSPPRPEPPRSVRDAITAIMSSDQPPCGVVITLDELHDADPAELKVVGNDLQLLKRRGFPVAFVAAGLAGRLELANPDRVSTFISRADIESDLGLVDDAEIQAAFVDTLATVGVGVSSEVAEYVTQRAGGLPYAMQVIGWHVVERCGLDGTITCDDVAEVIPDCHRRLLTGLQLPYAPSPGQARFLAAMVGSTPWVRTSVITQLLERTPQQLAPIRSRLIKAGYVRSPGYGQVAYAAAGYRALVATDPTLQPLVTAAYQAIRLIEDEI